MWRGRAAVAALWRQLGVNAKNMSTTQHDESFVSFGEQLLWLLLPTDAHGVLSGINIHALEEWMSDG